MTYILAFRTLFSALILVAALAAGPLRAAPYAAMVMDARTGEVLHSRNADTRLHPASLTKMMTLYIVFEAVRLGEVTMDTPVDISRNAASTPYALGFRAGSQVELRYLVRAAAVRSSNDAATAIAEAISGSEAAFARRMNATARALGMTRTTFRNAHGLTAEGHLSTAHDMTIMGRRLFYDYPQYYNIFGRTSTYAGPIGNVPSTNRQVLNNYRGADGIKTGYTRAAGFNLTASAERGGVRILATVFGGNSAATRNQRIMELLDMGFTRAPARATTRQPAMPVYESEGADDTLGSSQGRVIRMSGAVTSSPRPERRPELPELEPELVAAIASSVEAALANVIAPPVIQSAQSADVGTATDAATAARAADPVTTELALAIDEAVADAVPRGTLVPGPDGIVLLSGDAVSATRPRPRPIDVASVLARAEPFEPEIVTRSSSTGSRLFGVSLGRFDTENDATRMLLTTALAELGTFDNALRNVARREGYFEAQFAGMTEQEAINACVRLVARSLPCQTLGPS
ncbi:MAG: D-alanyl-D-alanine carboxypeptidase family protein [Pseudomonadota bacterium]